MRESELQKGAENLLVSCAGMGRGDTLLVLHEDPKLGYYDQEIADAIMRSAHALGIVATLEAVVFNPKVSDPGPELLGRMKAVDRTLFLARLGDQIRFRPSMSGIRPVVSYALDQYMLGSPFGTADFEAFVMLRNAVNAQLANASRIRVTCPLGTDFSGTGAKFPEEGADVTVARFPLSVFTPVPAGNFSGRVVQDGFLVGTGSQYYKPYACGLDTPLEIRFEGNRITGFKGNADDINAAQAHFNFVAQLYNIDPFHVHSWHAGIHPGCAFEQSASASFERWSGGAFGNPRLMHFHTCGAYAPGEISLNVLDPTIEIDDIPIWENGRFHPLRLNGGQKIFDQFVELPELFENPAQACGQGSGSRLSFG